MTAAPARAGVGRNAALLAVATIAARISTFALAIILGRELGAQAYGRYGFAAALATVVVPLADLGLTPYLIREVARRGGGARALTRRALRAKVASSVLVFVLVTLAVALPQDNSEVAVAVVALLGASLLDGVSQFVYGWYQGGERMGYEALATTAAAWARAVGGIALVLGGAGLVGVVVWIAIVAAAQVTWALLRLRRALPDADDADAAEAAEAQAIAWGAVASMGLVTLFAMVYLRADSILLGWLEGEEEVGWYTSAYTVVSALQIPAWMLAVALGPVFARTFSPDPGAFAAAWHDGVRAVTLVAVPLALVVCLLADDVIARLYGADFGPGGAALAVLVWSTPLWAWNMVVSAALRGGGRERWLTVVTGGGALVNVGANLWAIPRYGLEGAAAVTVATETAVLLGLAGLGLRHGVVPLPRLAVVRLAAALAALAAAALALRSVSVEVAAVGGLLAYGAVLLLTGALGREDLDRVRRAVLPG